MKYLNLSAARSSLPSLVDDAERVVIMRGSQPVAVLVNIDDYRAMQIMQTLAAEPSTLQKIMHTHERVRSGDLEGLEEFPVPGRPADRQGLKDRRRAAGLPIADVIDQMKEAVREEKERVRAVKNVDDATLEQVFLDLDRRLSEIQLDQVNGVPDSRAGSVSATRRRLLQRDRARRPTEPDTVKSR